MEAYLARAFASLTTGIYVLTVNENGHTHGMSSSWVTQVSGDPALFSAAVDNRHFSHGIINRTEMLGLNGPRRYFLAIQTPSEARGPSGHDSIRSLNRIPNH